MEAQGAIVDQWFGGNGRQTPPGMNLDSPYFGYINNNLRPGRSVALTLTGNAATGGSPAR